MAEGPLQSVATTHTIADSEINPSACQFPFRCVAPIKIAERYLSSGLIYCILAVNTGPVIGCEQKSIEVKFCRSNLRLCNANYAAEQGITASLW